MSALRSAQQWMHEALVLPRRVDGDVRDALLRASPRLTAADGLAIYQRGYFLRIASCMREQFPALCHALGEPLFDDFVADYISDKPPESHTLYDLGRRFPAWLADNRPDRDLPPAERERWIDFMIDLARFERQVFALFDAPGHEGRPFADAETPDDRLRLQPCFDLGAYDFPVAAYYHAVRQNQDATLPPAGRSFAALVRTDYVTRTIRLGEPQYLFLHAMAAGGGVEGGLEAAATHLATTPERVRESWHSSGDRQRWIDWGFFIAG
ncbi:MAG TPA: putative DNA-binding domain-containing protein [Allosphingosinicella sp.]|nr:putative DNA-binding domain-containing protein [Allosphingosinicella sp.]